MMKRAIILLALLFPTLVGAGDVTLSWRAPTEDEACTNAGPLSSPIATYKIYQLITEVEPPLEEVILENVFPGDYIYVATAVNEAGFESRMSGPSTQTVDTFVTIEPTVYTVQQFRNRFILLPVGTVALGLSCIREESVNGHYAIARDVVTWTGTQQPQVVVAKCG